MMKDETGLEIAIIGLDCRFPGAADAEAFRAGLMAGEDLVSRFTPEELRARGVVDALLEDPGYVAAQGVLPGHDRFDPGLFGMTPGEARLMEPQLRMLLSCGFRALEDGALVPGPETSCGVFVGAYYNTYRDILLRTGRMEDENDAFRANLVNEKDFLATQLAYRLDLVGPAVTVQTACSTSLVAVHQACQALLSGECDFALAGGATSRPVQDRGYLFQEGGIYSADGKTRSFDAQASGTVPSNGVGVVLLARYRDALAAGHPIRAVIRGSATGNDGSRRIGYTAPGQSGQARVVRKALAAAGLDPASISYIEAHGSGTALGDPIEIAALTQAYGRAAADSIAIGSVKTNIGHTHAASGVAGLIKAVLALEEARLPASLNFERPNPKIDFAETPFKVQDHAADWVERAHPRRAGVSSFGMGGTGAHVVIEEAPVTQGVEPGVARPHLLLLGAASEPALQQLGAVSAEALRSSATPGLGDVAKTLNEGRKRFAHRTAVVAESSEAAARALAQEAPDAIVSGRTDNVPQVDFLFPGLGDQRPGMAARLYESQPVFRQTVDDCLTILQPYFEAELPMDLFQARSGSGEGVDLRRMLGRGGAEAGASRLAETAVAQPLVFVIEVALARLWASWGVTPDRMIGYSLGEYVAAHLAGVLSLEDALHVVVRRSQAIGALPAGAMLAVGAPRDAVIALCPEGIEIAAVNGPAVCVVGGTAEDLDAFAERLSEMDIPCRPVQTTHAFHTSSLKPASEALLAALGEVTLKAPVRPYLSNVSGSWITAQEATDPHYWVRHMCETVQFDAMLRCLTGDDADALLLEVGPGQSTAGLVSQALVSHGRTRTVLSSLPSAYDDRDEQVYMTRTAGRLWVEGIELASEAVHGPEARLARLPGYPFDAERYWIEETGDALATSDPVQAPEGLYSTVGWRPLPPTQQVAHGATQGAARTQRWLLLGPVQITGPLVERLAEIAPDIPVAASKANCEGTIADALAEIEPSHVLYAGALVGMSTQAGAAQGFEAAQAHGFNALLPLARALADRPAAGAVDLVLASPGAWSVAGEAKIAPAFATLAGIARTLPHELDWVRCRVIDLAPGLLDAPSADLFCRELLAQDRPDLIALRKGRSWAQDVQPIALQETEGVQAVWEDCVALITGGTGAVGLVAAERLSKNGARAVALLSRSAGRPNPKLAAALARIEARGTAVMRIAADVSDRAALERAVAQILERFGRLNYVLHTAGVEGRGLLQLKTAEDAQSVMRPKCQGALALLAAVAPAAPRQVMLFSSTIALTGAAGQADYCAASAFLDALAAERTGEDGMQVVSVNWDAWREAGMAHRNLGAATDPDWQEMDHPMLCRWSRSGADWIYEADVRETDWLVDEHRMDGHPVIAGAGQIEMIRAAAAHALSGGETDGARALSIRDLVFFSPAVLSRDGGLTVRIALDATPDGHDIRAMSRPLIDASAPWRIHVEARLSNQPVDAAGVVDLEAVRSAAGMADHGAPVHDGPMGFGARSLCLRRIHASDTVALAEIALPEAFREEVETLPLHPSLLDICAAFVGLHLAERFRIPLSYGEITVHAPFTDRVFSRHVLHKPDTGAETQNSDITITDGSGRILVEVRNFVLKSIEDVDGHMQALLAGQSEAIVNLSEPARPDAAMPLASQLSHGLSGREGAGAIEAILQAHAGPQIVVSHRTISDIRAELQGTPDAAGGQPPVAAVQAPRRLATPFVAPEGDTETVLAEIWGQLLGIAGVGRFDNFFELGGHSLLGLSLANHIRQRLGVNILLSDVFSAPTIAEMADNIIIAETTS